MAFSCSKDAANCKTLFDSITTSSLGIALNIPPVISKEIAEYAIGFTRDCVNKLWCSNKVVILYQDLEDRSYWSKSNPHYRQMLDIAEPHLYCADCVAWPSDTHLCDRCNILVWVPGLASCDMCSNHILNIEDYPEAARKRFCDECCDGARQNECISCHSTVCGECFRCADADDGFCEDCWIQRQ